MKMGRGGALTALGLFVTLGCGSSEPSSTPNDGGGVVGPGGGVIVAPPPPPPGGEPPDGVFVSASKGIEGADGVKKRPLKTIAAALPIAAARRLPVIVCAETYAEMVELVDGVTMYGYFDCTDLEKWTRVEAHATIAAPTSPAVLAKDLSLPLRFEGFDVVGPDVPGNAGPGVPAASSYGMVVRGSKNIVLAHVSIRGGKGQDGNDGTEPPEGNAELSPDARGVDASYQRECVTNLLNPCNEFVIYGSAGGVSNCKVGANGGPGGRGGMGAVKVNGVARISPFTVTNTHGQPMVATSTTAVGGTMWFVGLNPGARGTDGGAGPNGSNGVWSFSKDGFLPGDGSAGETGLPGQGGGGGAGSDDVWATRNAGLTPQPGVYYCAAGAGGGAGGCGGIAGAGGTGGGASIGLFVVDSRMTIEQTKIASAQGGRAGSGAVGTEGMPGNWGGRGIWSLVDSREDRLYGAAGGRGGDGGASGLSGNGAPGPSIALVHTGGPPETKDVALIEGTAGVGAPTLTRGAQSQPGTTGVAKLEHTF